MNLRKFISPKQVHWFFSLAWVTLCAPSVMAAEPEKSVIQIFTFSQQPSWDAPWRFDPVRRASGSGFVVKGKRIMTNAHVVSWAKQLLVRKYQDPRPYLAQIQYIAHDCDLAILEVEDAHFFDNLEALEMGDLPAVRSAVVTYGYPAGGEQISYTKGVVSRIDHQPYSHIGNRGFLTVQTDAAINPGNSGGPVIQEDKVVGVAFQGLAGLEATGFFIPTSIIRHFLKDIEDGVYNGFPSAGLRISTMQNPAFRQYLKIPGNDSGVRIDAIDSITETGKYLQPEDVILQVGPYKVGSDSTILYEGNRVNLGVAFNQVQNGESLPLHIWRKGAEVSIDLPMKTMSGDANEGNQFTLPRYYIHAGLVFTPLSISYLKTFGQNWADSASSEIVYELFYRRQENPQQWRPEAIVLSSILSHPVNANFITKSRALVDKINGVRIEKLEDVIRGFETGGETHDVIEFISSQAFECLDKKEARQAHNEILKTYNIAKDRRL